MLVLRCFALCLLLHTIASAQLAGQTSSGIELRAYPDAVENGAEYTFELAIVNAGTLTLEAPEVEIRTGIHIESVESPSWECVMRRPGELVCARAQLAPSTTVIRVRAVAPSTGATMSVSAGLRANNFNGLYPRWEVPLHPSSATADVALRLSTERNPVPLSEPFQVSAEVENLGPTAASSVVVSGYWHAPIVSSSPGWNCTPIAYGFTCRAGLLQPGARRPLVLEVPAVNESWQNALYARADGLEVSDPIATNNTSSLTLAFGVAEQFERVLLPVATQTVQGGFDSRWVTELSLFLEGTEPVEAFPYVSQCRLCVCVDPPTNPIAPGHAEASGFIVPLSGTSTNPAMFFYFQKKPGQRMHFQLRARDTSRAVVNWGTGIPVLTDDDLEASPIQLMDLPVGDRYRQLVRVYGLDTEAPGRVTVRVFGMASPFAELATRELSLTTPEWNDSGYLSLPRAPAYAQLYLDGIPEIAGHARVRVELESQDGKRFWAFATITNNSSQMVTTVTPQRAP